MTETERKKALYDMLYLTSCGIKGAAPAAEKVKEMDMENVYQVSRSHFLDAIVCCALEKAELPDSGIMAKWLDRKSKAIRKNMLFDANTAQLFRFMDEKGIAHLPLKGSILKNMYPQSDMRQMSDNDILFDGKFRQEVHDWFIENGFKAEEYMVSHHDNYKKEPVLYYEMHVELYHVKTNSPLHRTYYQNVWDRLIRDDESSFGYHFTDEDFYVFITAHSFKHYNSGGTGLRSLLDSYVYLNAKESLLDWSYIETETEKLGIAEYEKMCRGLCKKAFEPELTLTAAETEKLEQFLFAGAYGTASENIKRGFENFTSKTGSTSKLAYIRYKLFPSMEAVKKYHPFFYRHKWLMPVLWVSRIFLALTKDRKKAFGSLKELKKIK